MDVILTIKPKYANLIIHGSKRFELRKKKLPVTSDSYVYLYSSSPTKAIVARFRVGKVVSGSLKDVWQTIKAESGITFDEYMAYYIGKRKAFAIEITELHVYDEPFDPSERIANFHPPQSYARVRRATMNGDVRRHVPSLTKLLSQIARRQNTPEESKMHSDEAH